jgi:hypothetical protein
LPITCRRERLSSCRRRGESLVFHTDDKPSFLSPTIVLA